LLETGRDLAPERYFKTGQSPARERGRKKRAGKSTMRAESDIGVTRYGLNERR
jgi:hypothetical protein